MLGLILYLGLILKEESDAADYYREQEKEREEEYDRERRVKRRAEQLKRLEEERKKQEDAARLQKIVEEREADYQRKMAEFEEWQRLQQEHEDAAMKVVTEIRESGQFVNFYELLNVGWSADIKEVKAEFDRRKHSKLSKQEHEGFLVLSAPGARFEYDLDCPPPKGFYTDSH